MPLDQTPQTPPKSAPVRTTIRSVQQRIGWLKRNPEFEGLEGTEREARMAPHVHAIKEKGNQTFQSAELEDANGTSVQVSKNRYAKQKGVEYAIRFTTQKGKSQETWSLTHEDYAMRNEIEIELAIDNTKSIEHVRRPSLVNADVYKSFSEAVEAILTGTLTQAEIQKLDEARKLVLEYAKGGYNSTEIQHITKAFTAAKQEGLRGL